MTLISSWQDSSELVPPRARANDNNWRYRARVVFRLAPRRRPADLIEPYFLQEAGQPRGIFVPPLVAEDRILWSKWFKRMAVAYACLCGSGLLIISNSGVRPLDATSQIERLAAKIERARRLDLEAAREIARVVSQPPYDCRQVACSSALETRNKAARKKLTQLLTAEEFSDRPVAKQRLLSAEAQR